MWEYATHNPGYFFLLVLIFVWAVERVIVAFINRNKPVVSCDHEDNGDEDDLP